MGYFIFEVSMNFPEQLKGQKIWLDGEIIQIEDALINVMTHGLHYSTAAFEGIRIYNHKPFLVKEHMERLHHSCRILMLELEHSVAELCEFAQQVVNINDIPFGYIRPLVWRGAEGMLLSGMGTKVHTAIAAWGTFENGRAEQKLRGAKLGYSQHRKWHPSHTFWSTKATCVYSLCYVMKREALSQGLDDMIALDLDDNLTEVSSANLFFIKDNQLFTAIPDCFLDGLTRQCIIKLAEKLGIKVNVCKVSKEMASSADAAFLTGTAIELMPVQSLESKQYQVDHPIYKKLETAFHELANS